MKAKRNTHIIVYNKETFNVVFSADAYTTISHKLLANPINKYVVLSHPKAEETLLKIDEVNGTDFFKLINTRRTLRRVKELVKKYKEYLLLKEYFNY